MEINLPSDITSADSLSARNLAFDRLSPLVRLQYQGEALPFILDTGGGETLLFVRFGQRFPQALLGTTHRVDWLDGAGSRVALSQQILPQLELSVDEVSVLLHNTGIYTEDQPAMPPVLGILGEDFLAGGFELDFRRMHFSVVGRNQSSPAVPTTP